MVNATHEQGSTDRRPPPASAERQRSLRLLPGTEVLGEAAGSGLREPPYLVCRCDGQVVQLSQVLYTIARHMDGRDAEAIAESATEDLQLRVTPEQIAYVAENKLVALGLIHRPDGSLPNLQHRDALLALKFRVGLIGERVVNRLAWLLKPLFLPPAVIASVLALLGFDVWLARSHGVATSVSAVIQRPSIVLALFGTTILSLAFHECGHAAACRYGGARPGRIGIGVYLIWPVF